MLFTSIKLGHIFSLLCLFAASVAKNFLVHQRPVSLRHICRCKIADRASGISAGFMVASGFGLLYTSGKGLEFYLDNVFFWAKLVLLGLASALIICTKIFFRRALNEKMAIVQVPHQIRGILIFDLLSLVAMSVLGVLIASGFYYLR